MSISLMPEDDEQGRVKRGSEELHVLSLFFFFLSGSH